MILPLFLASLPAHAAVFGIDNRQPITPASPYASLGSATAVAVLSANIEPSTTKPGTFKLDTQPLSPMLCADERFAADPSLSYACSGFLVAPDLMVTAGHCMVNTGKSQNESGMYCSAFGWLFDYQKDGNGNVALDAIPADKYVTCKKIIYAIREEKPPYRDFALVQLDHPVANRQPYVIASEPVVAGQFVNMIGYPMGTPMKVSPNGRITINDPGRQSFLTNLNAFEGNSGSVVFNTSHEAVGILIGGTPSADTFTDQAKACDRYNFCDASGKNCALPDKDTSKFPGYQGVGSEVQRIDPIVDLLKSIGR
jgi:V8-like Glu-specific endopeptidase